MGDSFSSGEGMSFGHYPNVPGSNPLREDWRHQDAYAPGMLAWYYLEMARRPGLMSSYNVNALNMQTNWGADHMDFVASSGADTHDIFWPQPDTESGVNRQPAQGDVLDSSTDLVGFGFGGNDAHYATLFKTAIEAYGVGTVLAASGGNSPNPITWQEYQEAEVGKHVDELLAGLPDVTDKLVNALNYTSNKASHAQIVVVLYPQGLKPSGNPDIPFIAGRSLDKMYKFGQSVNDAIRTAVARFQAQHPGGPVIQIFDPNSAGPGSSSVIAGHELGQPQSYFNKLVVSNKPELLNGHPIHAMQESFHPNQLGGVAMGKALATFLHDRYPQFWPEAPAFPKVTTNPQPWPDDPEGDHALNQYINNNLAQFCTNAGYPNLCVSPGTGSPGGGGTDPVPTGDSLNLFQWELDLWLLHAWMSIHDSNSGGNGDSGNSGGTTGDPFDTYSMLQGHWVHIYTDSNGVVHQDPMEPGFVPPPDKISPQSGTTTEPGSGGSGGPKDDGGSGDGGFDYSGDDSGWSVWTYSSNDGWNDWAGGGGGCDQTAGYSGGATAGELAVSRTGTVLVTFPMSIACDDGDGSQTA
jgi:lysophospholipase L1-like esterase